MTEGVDGDFRGQSAGGAGKDGRIEIPGDQRERVAAELEELGYEVKRVGG